MDKELLDILDKARANGATATQLQGIVDSYNAKKKNTETDFTSSSNGLSPTKSSADNSIQTVFGNQFNDLGLPQLSQENGAPLTIDPKTIPVTPFANQSEYVIGLQERLKTNKLTPQDSQVIYKNTNPISTFNSNDDAELQRLSELNKLSTENISALKIPASISAFIPEFENKSIGEIIDSPEAKYTQALQLKGNIVSEIDRLSVSANPKAPKSAYEKQKISEKQRELNQVEILIKKLSTQLADKGEQSVEATIRTDESGNAFNKTLNRLQAMMLGIGGAGQVAIAQETVDRVEQLPSSFVTGLNYYKYAEPVMFERLSKSLQTGEPISESQIAQITAQGLSIEENRLRDKYNQQAITRDEYVNGIRDIQVGRYENLLGNKETLRAFLSSGIAELADDANTAISSTLPVADIGSKVFGHRWNYTDSEIEMYGKAYAKANGLDPNDARVISAIKYLQDNEGAMLLENSIAKAGWARDLAKGLAQPIRGISSSIEDIGKSGAEVYAESQSQGNVNVSEKRLDRVENSWEGTVSAVMEGAGQFITQAGLAWATSGALGVASRGLIGARAATGMTEVGLATDEAAMIGNSIGAGVDLGSTSIAQSLGKRLLATKDFTSTLITSYAQSYDNNLKTALSYTSDDKTAKQVAGGMSLLEGLTENILSPLEVSRGIIKAVFKPKGATEGVLKIINDANIVDKQSAVSSFLKSTLKGGMETAKVVGSEILEEEVTQIADYAANAIMNPDSQSFMNRDLQSEILNTANQTGLSMVIPALLSGVGAANANNFSKGTLLIAAQNRQHLLDDMNKRLFVGDLTQDEYNEKAAIINTAAKANETLPAKANGTKLNTQEKADYVYSRVAEGVLNKRLAESEDVAEQNIIKSKIKEQQDFRIKLLQNENENINTIPEGENAEGKDAKSATTKTATGTSAENKLNDGLVIQSAVIEIGGKQYEGNNHAEAILKAKEAGEDISNVDRQAEGKFKLSDGTIIDRATAKEQFGQDRAELLIPQNEAANQANKDYAKITEADPDISVGEMIDKPGTYNGETGRFYQDGQAVIFKVEGKNKEYELGNIEEIKNTPISDLNITYEQSVVSINDEGNINVRGTDYNNNYSSPLAAINRDTDGNIVSVNLETTDGKKRTFRGSVAEDIAYQINLKEINKNNETRTEFEQFINEDETASKEMDNGAVLETSEKEPVKNNEPVSREKVVQEIKPQPKPTNEAKANEVQQSTEVKEPTITEANKVGEGRTPVTISGSTESERQLAIEKRKKETKQTPMVSDRDAILERISKFNKLSKVKKRQSFNEENKIKILVDSFNKKHDQKHTVYKLSNGDLEMRGNPTTKKSLGNIIKFTLKGGEKNIVDNARPLMERSDKTKQVFSDLLEANALPVARRINGEKMSDVEFDGTIQDIMDGIPSQRAENYLNSLENQIEEDAFDFDNPDKNVPLPTLNDVLGVTVEETEQMTPESIDEWLSKEAEFTPEEEILFDNIENLITYYEQEQSEPESGNAEKISATTGTGQESNITEDKQDRGEKPKDTGNTNVANAEVDKPVKVSERMRSFAASIRKNGITPDFLKIDDGNAKTKGLSAKQVDEFIATTIEKVADLIDAGTAISDAIKQGIADIKNLYDKNNVPVDEVKLTEWFTDLINNQAGVEEDVNEVAKKIKSDEITYIDAIDGKSQEFIDALDEALKGKRAYTFNEEGFRSNVRRQKEHGISKEDIIEGYESLKKLTNRQKELIDEVFGETADTDKAAADLMEAFRQLAKGEKPKKVLKRLAASDVTSLVQALSNALSYKAISNVQLEAMADYIVESIDLNKSEQYLNAMVNNSMVDVKQLVRAKLIIKLQEAGNDGLATTLVNQMADDAVSSGRATQSLVKAYEILGAKGNAKVRTAFAKKYAESVQEKALKLNTRMAEIISEKEAEIGKLNQRIHNEAQKSSSLSKLKDIIANLCGLRNKK